MKEKVRIQDKTHSEEIFTKYAKSESKEFDYDLEIILGCWKDYQKTRIILFKELVEFCEAIGYENLLLDKEFADFPDCTSFSYLYIDLLGIKSIKSFPNDKDFIQIIKEDYVVDDISLEKDGTLKFYFD